MRHLAVVPLIALFGCGGVVGDTVDRRTIIDSRDEYDPRSLDPALSTDVPTGRAVAYIFDGLTIFDEQARLQPGLAERWEVSPDGLTYTFHLRRGVQFHDGTPLLARHVVASFHRVLDPAVRGGRGWPLYPIRGAEEYAGGTGGQAVAGLAAPDDSTVVITLREPFAIFPKLLAMPVAAIVPDRTPENFGERPVGTGPWRLVEWRRDDYLLFARNENYWGGAPPADSLRARIIAEPSTAVAEFESGRVDVLRVPQGEAGQWEADPARRELLHSAQALILVYIGINVNRGPLTDVRVRQAINHAIDTETIIRTLAGGRGTRAAGVIPHALPGADQSRQPYAYDVDRARQLLAEAGHPNGISVDLWVGANPVFMRMAEAIQGYLNQAGIRTRIVQRETAAAREASRAGETDLFLKDWHADYPDAENFLYPLLHSTNTGVGGNISFYRNPRYDQIVTQARRELDEGRRNALYQEADALAFQEAPMVFLYFYNELFAVQRWIEGFQVPSIFNGQRWTGVGLRGSR